MSAAALTSHPTAGQEFVTTRIFDAPRALVWKCFTEPEHMKQWWGPKGSKVIASKMDLRIGGTYHGAMQSPDGAVMWAKFVYREVVPPERLVWVHSFSDEAGGLTRHPLSPTWPLKLLTTVTFDEMANDKTRLTLSWSPLEASAEEQKTFNAARDSMHVGWAGSFDQLAAYLARAEEEDEMASVTQAKPARAEREVTITRIFDAPRALVFKAWTDAKHLSRWWGPQGFTTPICQFDAQVGGIIRIDMRGPDGVVYPMKGEIRELIAPERLVFTNIALDNAGNHILEGLTVVTFREENGKTKMVLQTRATAVVDYAARHLAGMEIGWTQTIDKLQAMLASGA
jgi:uncharacterized protein YndB with AHSA1/START domain